MRRTTRNPRKTVTPFTGFPALAALPALLGVALCTGQQQQQQSPAPAGVEGGGVTAAAVAGRSKLVAPGANGTLVYAPWNDRGDTIPDFSNCGYKGGGVPLPVAPVKETLSPAPTGGDDLARVQAALDRVGALSPDPKTGLRGAVLLKKGTYRLSDALKMTRSGVVLRGEGPDTILLGTARKQYALVSVKGAERWTEVAGTRREVTDDYVPVGGRTVTVADGSGFRPGDTVMLGRRGNAAWITEIGMDRIAPRPNADPAGTKQWTPFELPFDRVVTKVEGNRVTLDAPLVCAIEKRWGGGYLAKYTDRGRIENVGVESLHGTCEFDRTKKATQRGVEYLSDEEHANRLVVFDDVKNAWAKNVSTRYMDGVTTTGYGAKWVTVEDGSSIDPVSVITGSRRYPYTTNGQLTLVRRCYARDSRHAFAFGSRVPGPNVFQDCKAEKEHATSEPHHRWSVGGLYDNVAANIAIQDRQWMGSGHGWAGANYVAWNCTGTLVVQKPPTAQNFAIGHVGKKVKGAFDRPDGWWESPGAHVAPRSLYDAQVAARRAK